MTAYARATDPATSHAAAKSVTDDLSKVKKTIMTLLAAPTTDEQLIKMYKVLADNKLTPQHSDSGLRTRRHELQTAGLIHAVGFTKTAANRATTVWKTK